ncbi:MAG TPA: hypothetical protein ENJ10_09580 [Caldithrix abyssi]|uniref:Uncharacterized protein n=1 Tax=Caldithrix abyssi TaxID=187145 RepID=A0A7V1LMW1_CALAY|nr:hypothetical protein [Caldithrix abyssi]
MIFFVIFQHYNSYGYIKIMCSGYIRSKTTRGVMAQEKLYIVIIGDIIRSRLQQERAALQKRFQTALGYSALKFADKVISPPTLTIGDEFQVVLPVDGPVFDLLAQFEFSMNYIPFRYGFGLGAIATQINRKAAIGMDGPAFYNAREALESARKNGFIYHFKGAGAPYTQSINLLLHWVSLRRASWKLLKKQSYYLYHHRGMKQKDIARRLEVSQPAVSKIIRDPAFGLAHETAKHVEFLWKGASS